MSEYQKGYSRINPAVLDINSRMQKATKIQRVLDDYRAKNPVNGIILDIGCSGGIILSNLLLPDSQKIGIDIDIDALKAAQMNKENIEGNLICADGINLPFRDNSLGIILCNHVYEHLPDSEELFREIFRTLKPGGVCYCAAGNALNIMEGHYHLPFLSWLPKRLAHYYMRITGRGEYYYENHLTWWNFQKRICMFVIHDYTIRVIRDPESYAGTEMIKPTGFIARIPVCILKVMYPFIPTWIIMLEKPVEYHR